jgi:hypothetical protein
MFASTTNIPGNFLLKLANTSEAPRGVFSAARGCGVSVRFGTKRP